ncbi:MAG: tetratricopeptide repeat protein, partial [Candidatus Sulfotelmatobacter sp.]
KEAAQTYLAYAQRLFDNGEADEAAKIIERALAVEPGSTGTLLLHAKILAQTHKNDAAIAILERLPEADAGGEITNLLIDLEISSEHVSKAADRARKQLARGSAHTALLEKVADALLQAGKAAEALPLVGELRGSMIEAGEQDKFLRLLLSSVEKLPGETEPLEMLADFARHTSDPFQLNAALTKLADIYSSNGNYARAEEMLQELVERNKGDERLSARLERLRSRGESPAEHAPAQIAAESSIDILPTREHFGEASLLESPETAAPKAEETLDEETQRYIAQALTDVDLFSSYGLTQKAANLLENVLKRAPRHTPTLERLLDLYLGASDENRTAELASQLEQIHGERGDTINADRFKELRQRFQKAAGLSEDSPPPAMPVSKLSDMHTETFESHAPSEASASGSASTATGPTEFEIALVPVEVDSTAPPAVPPNPTELTTSTPAQEVDLSDEWEAMVQEVGEETLLERKEAETPPPTSELPSEATTDLTEPAREVQPVEPLAAEAKTDDQSVDQMNAEARAAESIPGSAEFELELAPEPQPTPETSRTHSTTTEDFLSDLAAEVEDMEMPVHVPEVAAIRPAAPPPPQPEEAGVITAERLNELTEVFQEFREELGELGEEGEDLETHYNLGIAYREMGLLDEAIGEFQKVAKAVKEGKPFRYAMNCSTFLAICFMDKGEPRIAALWYREALELPGLEQETILALRYDLGVSLDLAGEADAALDNFRQVYAMNIDYRDVSGRIATLQKP